MRSEGLSQPKGPSKPLQNVFKNPSKTLQEGVEIDDALGFPGLKKSAPGTGRPVAENESLDHTTQCHPLNAKASAEKDPESQRKGEELTKKN